MCAVYISVCISEACMSVMCDLFCRTFLVMLAVVLQVYGVHGRSWD